MIAHTRAWSAQVLIAAATLGAPACAMEAGELGEEVFLESPTEDGKADSVNGRRILVSISEDKRVIFDPWQDEYCLGDPRGWVCGGNVAYGSVSTFTNDHTVAVRGTRITPLDEYSFYVFDVDGPDWTLYTWYPAELGQLIYVRPRGTEEEWALLSCPGTSFFTHRVIVDMVGRTIDDDADGLPPVDLASCGAPEGALEVSSLPFPIDRSRGSLDGEWSYALGVNRPVRP